MFDIPLDYQEAVMGGGIGIGIFLFLISVIKMMIKVGDSNKIIVVDGKKKKNTPKGLNFSIERGKTRVWPYIQRASTMDIGVFPINVRVEGVNSANGITVGADATACVCIDDDDEAMIYSAVQRLMGKKRSEIQSQIQQTLIGNFRGALNKATPLEAIGMTDVKDDINATEALAQNGERAQFRAELVRDINSDLSSFGIKVVSVSLQKIWDTSSYIANLAQKTLVEKRKQVEIEEARLSAEAEKAESDSDRRVKIARAQADEKIIAAQEKLELYKREAEASIQQAQLEADSSIEESQNRGAKDIQGQLVELQKLRNKSRVTIGAEADQKSEEILAEGQKQSIEILEHVKNEVLDQKAKLLGSISKEGKMVFFIQNQLPKLFQSFKENASEMIVDQYVVMDDENGFNNAVNRGPSAFVEFLKLFEQATGISVKSFLSGQDAAELAKQGGAQ
jgi:flotillin